MGVVDLTPAKVKTMDDLIRALQEKARITPKGQWVFGRRYQDTKLGRHPRRQDLDQASMDHPIRISHSSGHLCAVNSYVLKRAGITRETPDPPGGSFDRDEEGVPTGVCRERAKSSVWKGLPPAPLATRKERVEAYLRCFRRFLSEGITSIADAGSSYSKWELYEDLREAGQPVRVTMMVKSRDLSRLNKVERKTGHGDDRLRLGAVKMFHGNSLSGRTCWLYEPYDTINPKTGERDYTGIPPSRSQKSLDRLIFKVHEAGFQAAVHSNGDREIDMVLDAFEKALKALPRKDARHRIEHCSVVNENILKRVKKLGMVLALHSYVYEHGDKMEAYGEKRWKWMHANRSALDLGIPVAGNSDYGVSAADPMLRIQSMVTRKSAEGKVYGAEQRVSVMEALRVWTLGSAHACFEEKNRGSLEVGKLADFVILAADPTRAPPDEIHRIRVDKTIIGGRVEYERE